MAGHTGCCGGAGNAGPISLRQDAILACRPPSTAGAIVYDHFHQHRWRIGVDHSEVESALVKEGASEPLRIGTAILVLIDLVDNPVFSCIVDI